MEAVARILSIPNVVRHPLAACLFVTYDPNQTPQLHLPADASPPQSPGRLVALFGIHVDDLLGCGDTNNQIYKDVKEQLHMWEEKNLQYCGCDITKGNNHATNSIPPQTEADHHQPTTQGPTRRTTQPQRNYATTSFGWITPVAKYSVFTTSTMCCIPIGWQRARALSPVWNLETRCSGWQRPMLMLDYAITLWEKLMASPSWFSPMPPIPAGMILALKEDTYFTWYTMLSSMARRTTTTFWIEIG